MNRRSFLALSGTSAVALLAGCSSNEPNPVNIDNLEVTQKDPNTIRVKGRGEVSTTPTQATLRVRVKAQDPDSASAVVEELSRKSDKMISQLTKYGLSESDIESTGYNIREDRYNDHTVNKYTGYHRYTITVTDHKSVGEVIDLVSKSGAGGIDGVSFGIDDDTREELYNKAITKAVEDAREEAELYANTAGVELSEVLEIQPQSQNHQPILYRNYASKTDSGAAAPPTDILEGDVVVTATVTITYKITSTGTKM